MRQPQKEERLIIQVEVSNGHKLVRPIWTA